MNNSMVLYMENQKWTSHGAFVRWEQKIRLHRTRLSGNSIAHIWTPEDNHPNSSYFFGICDISQVHVCYDYPQLVKHDDGKTTMIFPKQIPCPPSSWEVCLHCHVWWHRRVFTYSNLQNKPRKMGTAVASSTTVQGFGNRIPNLWALWASHKIRTRHPPIWGSFSFPARFWIPSRLLGS